MAPTTNTQAVTAHIPSPLVAKVDEMATKLDRSRDWIVRQALTDWAELEDARDLQTRMALADVDAGRVVSHDQVRAWANGLS